MLCTYTVCVYVCISVCYVYSRVCVHCVYNNGKSKLMITDKQRAQWGKGQPTFSAYFVKK